MGNTPSTEALAINDIHIKYGDAEALRGVSIRVSFGETVTIIGANGAGKTTLLRGISGLLRPAQGTILFDGQLLNGEPAYKIRQMGLVHVPEGRGILRNISVHENLILGALGEDRKKQITMAQSMYDRFPLLQARRKQSGGALSGGEQQILAIARGLMGKPRVLMLDEPSLGLAPILVDEVFRILKGLRETGVTLLLVEQNARQALDIADRAYVMEVGRIIAEGSREKILSDRQIVDAYLGI